MLSFKHCVALILLLGGVGINFPACTTANSPSDGGNHDSSVLPESIIEGDSTDRNLCTSACINGGTDRRICEEKCKGGSQAACYDGCIRKNLEYTACQTACSKTPCKTDKDCKPTQSCGSKGTCFTKKSTCKSDKECKAPLSCNSKGFCAEPVKCLSDKNCYGDPKYSRCDAKAGKCVPNACESSCAGDGKSAEDCKKECSYAPYKKTHGEVCIQRNGFYRCWDQYIPKAVGKNPPLVIDIHGYGASPEFQRNLSGWRTLADNEKFVVVEPYGLAKSWNAGKTCCHPASSDNIDDVGFLRALVAQLIQKQGVDAKRIYVTGHSNGCAMAQRFAAQASDLVAAVACMSLYLLVEPSTDYKPVPVMEIHGLDDKTAQYSKSNFPGAVENFKKWGSLNDCTGKPVETWRDGKSYTQTYKNCKGGTKVSLVTLDKIGHYPYGGKGVITNATRKAWEFVRSFSR